MHDSSLHGDPDPILARVARESPIEELISHVLGVRSQGGQPGEDRLRAVGNADSLVEIAAEARKPSDVAGFAIALGTRGEQDLAALALDVAAASREPCDLSALAAG